MQGYNFFSGSILVNGLSVGTVLLCTAVSLILGICVSAVYMAGNKYNKNFVMTLAILPAIVQFIVLLVNGNIGAGVAVLGAFSLIRFRSVPGNSKDIGTIFFTMAIGIVIGMGYLFYGILFFVVIGAMNFLLSVSHFGNGEQGIRILRITIPEDLDYDGLFDDLFVEYADSAELDKVKTTNMGSLFELTYHIQLKSAAMPKAFIDALRCRNGNLNITLSREHSLPEEL
jgi:hypothetical protein